MTTKLTHRQVEGLLGAFALDAIDPDEHAVVAAHLLDCPACRSEVALGRETAAVLEFPESPPPSALWDRIASALENATPLPEPAP